MVGAGSVGATYCYALAQSGLADEDADYADAQVVVITAGVAQRPGETRLQLLMKNAEIIGNIAENIASHKCKGVMLIVSNPVDVLTYIALKRSGWDRSRVIGSGTVLDSARFRHLLSNHCGVDVHNVHAYILGEHQGCLSECPMCCIGWRHKQDNRQSATKRRTRFPLQLCQYSQ